MSVDIVHGNALDLPIEDGTVDLVVTSPPYFGLRSYTDGGEHYTGQLGDEPTPAEFVDALIAATAEMVRVLKPSGSIWVNLGDKYNSAASGQNGTGGTSMTGGRHDRMGGRGDTFAGARQKSLLGIPWRYAIRACDDLGLILRAEIIWSKPNGLPESVTDRVRRSHETWFHFTREPRYFSAVDEIREAHRDTSAHALGRRARTDARLDLAEAGMVSTHNPLGKLPGSVWEVPTQPLTVPPELGVDHFAAFPMEWPRRIIQGWCPRQVCTTCGQGRRPVVDKKPMRWRESPSIAGRTAPGTSRKPMSGTMLAASETTITGYACACPDTSAPATPGVVLNPFGGTGTTALVAYALGRRGISVDLSEDYCRLARWRTSDPGQLALALGVGKPPVERCGTDDLLALLDGGDAA